MMFAYLISETLWWKGYGTELIKGLVVWCKSSRNIRSLSGGVATKNTGSARILEKCGFVALDHATSVKDTMIVK